MEDIDLGFEHGAHESTPVWAVFGDLMSGLLGAFVIILVGVLGVQLELATSLEAEIQKRQQEEQRREALEKALAGPLAAGRVTLDNGKIGISGNVLFALNSDQLQALSDEVGESRSLLVCCAAYRGDADRFRNLTLKKIPKMVLSKCEWGHDDYSLNVQNLPMASQPVSATTSGSASKSKKAVNPAQGGLFGGDAA